MFKQLFSLLLLSGILNGCTTLRVIDQDNATDLSKIQSREAQVKLLDGRQIDAINLKLRLDSTSFFDRTAKQSKVVATAEIAEIIVARKNAGAKKGAIIGVLSGVTLGAIIGFALGDDPPPCDIEDPFEKVFCEIIDELDLPFEGERYSAEEKAVILGLTSGVVGALVGRTIGKAVGQKDRYKFEMKEGKSNP